MPTAKAGLKPGVKVVIGGEEYTAPQLNFGALRAMAVLDQKSLTSVHDLLAFVLLESLKRNYDGIDAAWLNATLEGSEMDAVAEAQVAILKASGLKLQGGESGEAPAAA